MVSPENCDLAQRNFCATLTNLQISAIFAVTSNFCAISYAYVQFGLALLRPPIIFDRLSMPKIDRLTGKPRSSTGNESVPIQLAQCWFPGLAIFNAKILIYFSNKIYGRNFIKQHSETVMVLNYQNADCSLEKKIIVSFIIIFDTFSFPMCLYTASQKNKTPNSWP